MSETLSFEQQSTEYGKVNRDVNSVANMSTEARLLHEKKELINNAAAVADLLNTFQTALQLSPYLASQPKVASYLNYLVQEVQENKDHWQYDNKIAGRIANTLQIMHTRLLVAPTKQMDTQDLLNFVKMTITEVRYIKANVGINRIIEGDTIKLAIPDTLKFTKVAPVTYEPTQEQVASEPPPDDELHIGVPLQSDNAMNPLMGLEFQKGNLSLGAFAGPQQDIGQPATLKNIPAGKIETKITF